MNGAALVIRQVTKRITGPVDVCALVDASLVIRPGEFVAIVGASGSGKTTLLSILGLLARPTSGSYLLNGDATEGLTESDRDALRSTSIGFVFQNSYVLGEQTVAENVALPLRTRVMSTSEIDRQVTHALTQIGLSDKATRMAAELSGGEKQRVAVARAIVAQPTLLLADEPTGALDRENSEQLIRLFRAINAAGTTVVVVTHDPLVGDAADRRIQLVDGRTTAPPHFSPGTDLPRGGSRRQKARVPLTRRFMAEVAEGVNGLLTRPVRGFLVMVAHVLGIAALVAAVGLTNSAHASVVGHLTTAGSDLVRVYPPAGAAADAGPVASDETLAQLASLEGVAVVASVRTYPSRENPVRRLPLAGGETFSGRITVVSRSFLDIHGLAAETGSGELLENAWEGPVAILGARAADDLSVPAASPGVVVYVNQRPVPVVGVLHSSDDAVFDDVLYVSAAVSPMLALPTEEYLEVQTEVGYAEPVAAAIPSLLNPADPGAYQVSTVAELRDLQSGISSDLAQLLRSVGIVVLLLSTATAAISLFLSVRQRAPQIALRRAVGASRGAIGRLFVYEGLLLGLLGGVWGTFVGIVVVWGITASRGEPLSLGVGVVLLGPISSLVAASVAAAYPARYAARQDPAAILRSS
ncbi:MAG: ATP-binding cassette domain-containing protein [Propioniciclava sp.]